jgi:nitrous oxidase accessory protein NosD
MAQSSPIGWRNTISGYGNIVSNNVIDTVDLYGIFMDVSPAWLWGTRIEGNTVTKLQTADAISGIRVYGPMTNCTGNIISEVSGFAIAAIDAYEADQSFITNNQITGSDVGIKIPTARSIDPVLTPNEFFDVTTPFGS